MKMAHIETYKAKVVSPEKETHNSYGLFVTGAHLGEWRKNS